MGHGLLQTYQPYHNGTKEPTMSPMKRYATKQAKARKHRRLKAQERLQHQRAQAQRYIEALHQTLKEGFNIALGLSALVLETFLGFEATVFSGFGLFGSVSFHGRHGGLLRTVVVWLVGLQETMPHLG